MLHRQARPDLTVVLIGGVRTPSDALVGPIALTALRSLHVDMLFMGVHGMTEDSGFTTPNLLEAETNRALIAVGRAPRRRRRPHEVGRARPEPDGATWGRRRCWSPTTGSTPTRRRSWASTSSG